VLACEGSDQAAGHVADRRRDDHLFDDLISRTSSMSGATTMRRHQMALVDVARARVAYAATVNELAGKGSWSIPCTPVATFHKPEPRRPKVIPS
jgi:hypothetical protein